MPSFVYKAKSPSGQPVEGVMDAEGRAAVVSRLQQQGFYPVSIEQGVLKGGKVVAAAPTRTNGARLPALSLGRRKKETSKKDVSTAKPAAKVAPEKAQAPGMSLPFMSRNKVKSSDLASFNRQLADLLGAGIPLVKALTILGKQTEHDAFRQIILDVNADVQDGATFADALGKHPALFSKLYTAMVRSGEAGGMLDEVLQRLADFSEQEEQIKGKIKSALAYPLVMIIAGTGAVIVMFAYVIPKIVATFRELNQTLPMITQILIAISEVVQSYWYIVIGVAVGLWMLFARFVNTPEGKLLWHRTMLRVPVAGEVVRKREVSRFARTLGSLLRNGVSILPALGITREVLNNVVARGEVDRIIEEITQGNSIAVPLKNSQIFPSVAINMMAVGEETGQLDHVLLRISSSYEMEVERQVRTLTSLIEPLIIVAIAFVVGFIVIAMLLPIFSLDPSGGAG